MRKSAAQWLEDLGNPDQRIAHRARLRLGGLSAADSWMAAELLSAVDGSDERQRFWAITGLARLARNNALGVAADDICRRLISVAQSDPASGTRQVALHALGRCPGQADLVVPAIVNVVRRDGDAMVRAEGIRALGSLRRAAASAAGFLVAALDDRGADVAWYASMALKFVPVSDPHDVEAIISASTGHQDSEVRSQLEAAIEMHGYRRSGGG